MNFDALMSEYSDTYKDAYGVRPRFLPSEEDMPKALERLHAIVAVEIKLDNIARSAYLQEAQKKMSLHRINKVHTFTNNPFTVLASIK